MRRADVAGQPTRTGGEMPERHVMEGPATGQLRGRIAAATVFFILLGAMIFALPPRALAAGGGAQVSVGISVSFGPPPLPIYAQPMCPGPGYMWTPGYWAWDPNYGYYWVPGTWVLAPFPGALWTPGYWGWDPGVSLFIWHSGYWGTRVGFYGGINYGFGYPGYGYYGGYWRGRYFYYNRAVNRLDYRLNRRYYNRRVDIRNRTYVSYNGGRGGIDARPTRRDRDAERFRRMGAIASQRNQEIMARRTPEMRWSRNRGRPDIAATPRAEMFRHRGVSRATRPGGVYRPPESRRNQPQPRYRTPERRNQPAPNRNQQRRNEQPRNQQRRYEQPRSQQPRYQQPRNQQPRYEQPRNQQPRSRPQRQQQQQQQPQYRGQQQGRRSQAQGQQRGRGQQQRQEKSNRGKGKKKDQNRQNGQDHQRR